MHDSMIVRFASPMLSTFLMVVAIGLLSTLTPLMLINNHFSIWVVGLTAAAYFIGLALGSIYAQNTVMRVGHIRAFVLFVALLALGTLWQGASMNAWIWCFTRCVCGYALAGLFIVIESWFIALSTPSNKGQVIGLYTICYYVGMTVGQLILQAPHESNFSFFYLSAALLFASIIPVSFTKISAPTIDNAERTSILKLCRELPLGCMIVFVSGILLSVAYSVYPAILHQSAVSHAGTANAMALMVIGGAVFQWPIGKLSDSYGRRKILLGMSILTVIISLLAFLCVSRWSWYALSFGLGACLFAYYPLGISYTTDRAKPNQIVSVIAAMTLIYAMGSVVGPVISAWLIWIFGPMGYFILLIIAVLLLGVYALIRLKFMPTSEVRHPYKAIATPIISDNLASATAEPEEPATRKSPAKRTRKASAKPK